MKSVLQYFLLINLSVILFACKDKPIDTVYVKSALWSWSKGFKVGDGDFIEFEKSNFYTLKGDTILRKGVPRATIIKLDKKNFLMKIKTLDGKQEGEYRDEAESLK